MSERNGLAEAGQAYSRLSILELIALLALVSVYAMNQPIRRSSKGHIHRHTISREVLL